MQEAERAAAAEEMGVGGELPSLSADDLQKLQTAFKYIIVLPSSIFQSLLSSGILHLICSCRCDVKK
jgi:hypothetical protein